MKVCIMGLGYVGLPLAMLFLKKHEVVGFDVDLRKLKMLAEDKSYLTDVNDPEIMEARKKGFRFTALEEGIRHCTAFIICVPTPVDKKNIPELSFIISATRTVSRVLKKGDLVALESTTYPGTTEEIVVPILEESGLRAGSDFSVAFSPERVDPSNKRWNIENTPKVVGGIDEDSTQKALKLYGSVIQTMVPVVDCKTAEAVKITENIFRAVNIALMNELCLIYEKMGINVWDVVEAASTKPYSFMPHYPGPGVGGHCIPVDPYYLSWKARRLGFSSKFIEMSGEINDYMKLHTSYKVLQALNAAGLDVGESKVVLYGASYKKDISDTREAPTKKIYEVLQTHGAHVLVTDPFVESFETTFGPVKTLKDIYEALRDSDCLVFLVDHTEAFYLDFERVANLMRHRIIVDARNIVRIPPPGFEYHGLGKGRFP